MLMFIYILLGVITFVSCTLTIYFYHKYKFSISLLDDIADTYQNKIILELPEEDQNHILLEEDYHPTISEILEAKYAREEE